MKAPDRPYLLLVFVVILLSVVGCASSGGEGQTPAIATTTAPQVTETANPTPMLEPPTATPERTATATPVNEGSVSLDAWTLSLQTALVERHFDSLESMMSSPFALGIWRSEWQTLDPASAIEQLRMTYLPEEAEVRFSPRDTDVAALLDGIPPETMLGPDVKVVAALHATGWASGEGEAILLVVEGQDGTFSWNALLFSAIPFAAGAETSVPPSFEAATYRDDFAGFELDYPAAWVLDETNAANKSERGYYVQLTSWFHAPGDIAEDTPPGGSRMDATVLNWDPKNDLDAFIDVRKQAWSASGMEVLSEEQYTLMGGHRAVRFLIEGVDGEQALLITTTVGQRYLVLSGTGDLDVLAEIAGTVRVLSSTQ